MSLALCMHRDPMDMPVAISRCFGTLLIKALRPTSNTRAFTAHRARANVSFRKAVVHTLQFSNFRYLRVTRTWNIVFTTTAFHGRDVDRESIAFRCPGILIVRKTKKRNKEASTSGSTPLSVTSICMDFGGECRYQTRIDSNNAIVS